MNDAPFTGILGHGPLLRSLSRAMAEERLASALLFHGPAGVGKLTAALALFRGLLCQVSSPDPCGECESCRRISPQALLHSDVGLLYPRRSPASGEADDGTDDEGAGEGARQAPTAAADLHLLQEEARANPRWMIPVGKTRERLGELFLSPGGGRRRVLLVLSAERLGPSSSNALLKVLEEPPGSALLVLLCESRGALLPTIRSRCQSCRFSPLSRAQVEEFLRSRGVPSGEEARLIASLSGGRIGAALNLARSASDYRSRRESLVRLLSELRRERSAAACLAAAGTLLSEETDAPDDLAILMDILRDAMLSGAGCPPSLLTDAREGAPEGIAGLSPFQAALLLPRIERAREDLRRFVNRQVAVEALFLDLADPSPSLSEVD